MRGRPSGAAQLGLPTVPPTSPVPTQGSSAHSDSQPLASERLELLKAQRLGQQLKNEQTAGDLVPLSEGVRRWNEAARMLRERMQAEMRGLAERLINLPDTRSAMLMIEEKVDQVFCDVATEIENGGAGDEDDDLGANDPDAT